MTQLESENILGYSVTGGGVARCVESIMAWIGRGEGCRWLACLNPHSYAEALRQSTFADALNSADWLIPDGVGIVLASRFLGGGIRGRVTGSDIFRELMTQLNHSGTHKVFFLGSTENTLAEIRSRVARDYPRVQVVGTWSPPFRDEYTNEELNAMVLAINNSAPDVLWVGMTAPKQELWIQKSVDRLETIKFAAAIGAVFDFYAGQVKRSHPAFQTLGMEWLPRLVQQPRRLWRRMFVSAPIFVWSVIRQKIGIRRD